MAKPSRSYIFDTTKANEIFDHLLADKKFKFSFDHKFPSFSEMEGKKYCKYHNSWNQTTNNSIIFQNDIQDMIDRGEFKFPKNTKPGIGVDT